MNIRQSYKSQYRIVISQILVLLVLSAGFPLPAQSPDPLDIVRRSVAQDRLNFERGRDYTFLERVETRELDSRGKVAKTESETFDVLILGGRPYKKLIAKNGRPLSGSEETRANADFEKELRKRQSESEGQRRAESSRAEKRRRESRAFLAEVPNAFNFTLAGTETIDGRPVWIIGAVPRPGFQSKVKRADLLTKFRGRLWIDQQDLQWVRVEAETIDTVSFGLFLARLGPGARLTFRQSLVNGEIWLPSQATTRLDARVALFKRYNAEVDVAWTQYRKFQTDSRVVAATELTSEP